MKKNKKKLLISAVGIIALITVFLIISMVVNKMHKQESVLKTVDYLEKNYGDGNFIVIETNKKDNNYEHTVESKYTDSNFKVTIDKNNTVLTENFIDVYGLEAFDLNNYGNVLECVYMTKINELNAKIQEVLDAKIVFQTIKVDDNYGYKLKGKVPTKKDLINSLEFEQPSIKFNKTITSEEDLLVEIKKAIKLLKETLKDENIKYKNKFVIYSFDNTTIDSKLLVDNGYIYISDYDEFDKIRFNMFNKDLIIKKSDL